MSTENRRNKRAPANTALDAAFGAKVPRTRIRLIDAMIVLAAVATGCAFTRQLSYATDGIISWTSLSESWHTFSAVRARGDLSSSNACGFLTEIALQLVISALPILIALTLSILPLRMSERRPYRESAVSPGTMVVLASLIAAAFLAIVVIVARLARVGNESVDYIPALDALVFAPAFVSLAILSAWTTLFFAGHWRPEPSLADRLGRTLGLLWIVVGFLLIGVYLHQLAVSRSGGVRTQPPQSTEPIR
jgi:hypothetical protein